MKNLPTNLSIKPTTGVNSSKTIATVNIKVDKFNQKLTSIDYRKVEVAQQKNEGYVQSLIYKIRSSKIWQISFVTGTSKSNVSLLKNKPVDDFYIKSFLENINKANVPSEYISDSLEAINYYYDFARKFRDYCEKGSQEEIETLISSFYSPSNPYSAYFRGEVYSLLKTIHDKSSHKQNCVFSPKDCANRIYQLLDPSFDASTLNNLYIHDRISSKTNAKFFQKIHELLDAIDFSRSVDSNIEVHLTNDNNWKDVLQIVGVDSTYRLVGSLNQSNSDLLVIDRVNKVYYGVDMKTKFWLNGVYSNESFFTSLGNVPQKERIKITQNQKNQLILSFLNKLKDPSLTDEQRDKINFRISEILKSNDSTPIINTNPFPYANIGNSNASVTAITFGNGSPDRPYVPLGFDSV